MSHWRKRIRDLDSTIRDRYESVAEAFETAWADASASEPQIETYLEDGPVRLPLLVHLVKCDLEFRYGRGEERHLEDYLARFPELSGDFDAMLELVLCESHVAERSLDADELARRFPALAPKLIAAIQPSAAPAPWSLPPEYENQGELGRGNWGVVYKVRHRRLNRLEALKAVDPHKANEAKLRSRVQRLREEIPIAARLNHPNIVHVYGDGERGGIPYFAMEYCAGGSLRERIDQAPFSPRDAATLIRTLAIAVHHIHVFGHIHRDLKPQNVLFGDDDVPKVADFGLALNREESDRPDFAGTPLYMAPEQIDASCGKVDCTADVYALGVMLHEMLTQKPPLTGSTPGELFANIRLQTPAPPAGVPADLSAVVAKCLAKRPEDRYQNAHDLADDLGLFLDGGLVKSRRHSLARRAEHWVRKNRIATLIAVWILVVIATIGWYRTQLWQQEIDQANERSLHAERLAESERKREHAAQVATARQTARRGNFKAALAAYDRAVGDNESDHLRLRVERLVGYFATNEIGKLIAELDDLEKQSLGELTPQVQLMRAAWLVCDVNKPGEGRVLAMKALDRRDDLFSDADRHFAEGIAADRVGVALRSFEKAVKSDPFHYLASSCHAVTLAAVGDREKAKRQTEFLRTVFPDSPMPELTDAIMAVMEGDRRTLDSQMLALAAKLPPDQRGSATRMRDFLMTIVDLQDISVRSAEDHVGFLDGVSGFMLLNKANRLGKATHPEPIGLPVPAVSLCCGRLLEMAAIQTEVGVGSNPGLNLETTLRRLKAISDDQPDGLLQLMEATIRLRLAIKTINQGDVPAIKAALEQVSGLANAAQRTPSIAPRLPTPYLARGLTLITDLTAARFNPKTTPQELVDLRNQAIRLVAEGRRWPKLRQDMAAFAVSLAVVPLTAAQASEWHIETEEGKKAYRARNQAVADVCTLLLESWAVEDANNPLIASLRSRVKASEQSSGLVDPR